MVNRDYECPACETRYELATPSELGSKPIQHFCDTCKQEVMLERIWINAPAVAFGMLGGSVVGSGFHNTDYGRANSDLIKGRAIENKQKFEEKISKNNP